MTPPAAPAAATTAAIPFGQAPQPVPGGNAGGFVAATLLLAAAFVVLWLLRKRGFGAAARVVTGTANGPEGIALTQRLRLSPTCQAYVLREGDVRMLVVESRYGVDVRPLPREEGAP